jgi:hypothetical protein
LPAAMSSSSSSSSSSASRWPNTVKSAATADGHVRARAEYKLFLRCVEQQRASLHVLEWVRSTAKLTHFFGAALETALVRARWRCFD